MTSLHHLHHCVEPPVYYYYRSMSLSHNADDTTFVIVLIQQHNHGETPLLPTLSNRVYSAVVIFLTGFQLSLLFRSASVDPSRPSRKTV